MVRLMVSVSVSVCVFKELQRRFIANELCVRRCITMIEKRYIRERGKTNNSAHTQFRLKTKKIINFQWKIRWCYLRFTSLTTKRFMKYFFLSFCSDFQVFILLNRISYCNNTCFSFKMRTIDWIEIIIKNRADINVSPVLVFPFVVVVSAAAFAVHLKSFTCI